MVCIMYRAKVLEAYIRGDILMNANKLKDMEGCQRLYIQRDLTFQQRQELFRKRDLLRAQSSSVAPLDSPLVTRDVGNVQETAASRSQLSGRKGTFAGSLRGTGRGGGLRPHHYSKATHSGKFPRTSSFGATQGVPPVRSADALPMSRPAAKENFRKR